MFKYESFVPQEPKSNSNISAARGISKPDIIQLSHVTAGIALIKWSPVLNSCSLSLATLRFKTCCGYILGAVENVVHLWDDG